MYSWPGHGEKVALGCVGNADAARGTKAAPLASDFSAREPGGSFGNVGLGVCA
ncbi:MAG: hypothetical protein IT425_14400 [Pirellulales bacterium]|nr:hypothetical protein [Pirellulales bacterium]